MEEKITDKSDLICITNSNLDVQKLIDYVTLPECGGISVFIGRSRRALTLSEIHVL